MKRILVFIYAVICYLIFFATFIWMVLFLGDFKAFVPTTVNSGGSESLFPALYINLGLIALFGIQHTVMARKAFKEWWLKVVPKPMERSTYVLFSSLVIILLLWFWQPVTQPIWQVETTWISLILQWGFWLGWLILLLSTFMISHFNLFGLEQAYQYLKDNTPEAPRFMEPGLYNYVRHPLMLGFLIAFWSTPVMTVGQLVFSSGMTAYIIIGVYFEEKALVRQFGEEYRNYRSRVPKFIPGFKTNN